MGVQKLSIMPDNLHKILAQQYVLPKYLAQLVQLQFGIHHFSLKYSFLKIFFKNEIFMTHFLVLLLFAVFLRRYQMSLYFSFPQRCEPKSSKFHIYSIVYVGQNFSDMYFTRYTITHSLNYAFCFNFQLYLYCNCPRGKNSLLDPELCRHLGLAVIQDTVFVLKLNYILIS